MNSKIETNSSVIASCLIPCLNEASFIHNCLNALLAQDYDKDKMEILVLDGGSTDGTLDVLKKYETENTCIRVLHNTKKVTPAALNLGIKKSKGQYIILFGAHSTYNKEYISRCIHYIERDKVDHVGGIGKIVPQTDGYLANALILLITHPFGVGNSLMRIGVNKPTLSDTASTGCYRKALFEKIGNFNEKLIRNQDLELNLRLKKMNGKIMVYPDLICTYYARSSLLKVIKHSYANGQWVFLTLIWANHSASIRHLIPFFFTSGILVGAALSYYIKPVKIAYLSILATYALLTLIASIHLVIREKKPRYFPIMPLIFFSYHFSYGFGSIIGLIKMLTTSDFYKKVYS